MIKTQRYIDIKSVLGGYRAPNGKIIEIDFTSEKLDPRIIYTGPQHYYKRRDDGLMQLSEQGEYPLEWQASIVGDNIVWIPLGRHEPEQSNQNLITDTHFAGFTQPSGDGPWIYNGAPVPTVQDVVQQPPALATASVSVAVSWNKGGIYDETAAQWIINDTTPFSEMPWLLNGYGWQKRQWMTFNVNTDGNTLRLYPARADSANYLYGKFSVSGARQLTFSFFELLVSPSRLIQAVQLEYGQSPSSPITQESPFREASTVSIITGDPLEMVIHYSNGDEQWISNPGPIYNISQNTRPWGTRYIQRITFP